MSRQRKKISLASVVNPFRYLVPDWFERLYEECEEEEGSSDWPVQLLEGRARSAVWGMARLLGVVTEGVAANACRLLERFFAADTKAYISTAIQQGELEEHGWEEYRRQLQERTPLLMASCVQIAAKMNCACLQLTASKVHATLQSRGLHYSSEEVVASEYEVYQALGFRVPLWTPVQVAELVALQGGGGAALRCVALCAELAALRGARLAATLERLGALPLAGGVVLAATRLCGGAAARLGAGARLAGADGAQLAACTRAPPALLACVADLLLSALLDDDTDHSDTDS